MCALVAGKNKSLEGTMNIEYHIISKSHLNCSFMATYFQPYCTPTASSCVAEVSRQDLGCKVSCTGLYADKEHSDITVYADSALYKQTKEILTLAEKGTF